MTSGRLPDPAKALYRQEPTKEPTTKALADEIGGLEYERGLMRKAEDYRAGRPETVTLDELEEILA